MAPLHIHEALAGHDSRLKEPWAHTPHDHRFHGQCCWPWPWHSPPWTNQPSWKQKRWSVTQAALGMNATDSHSYDLIFTSLSNINTFHIVGSLQLSSRAIKRLSLPILQMNVPVSHKPPSFLRIYLPVSVPQLHLYNLFWKFFVFYNTAKLSYSFRSSTCCAFFMRPSPVNPGTLTSTFFEFQLVTGLCRWGSGKESACQCRRWGFNFWAGRFPGVGNGNPLQYSCLENSMDRGAW